MAAYLPRNPFSQFRAKWGFFGLAAPLYAEDAFEARYLNQSGRVQECVGVSDRSALHPTLG